MDTEQYNKLKAAIKRADELKEEINKLEASVAYLEKMAQTKEPARATINNSSYFYLLPEDFELLRTIRTTQIDMRKKELEAL